MAQIGDFQDLLDAISSAKSILEPSKLDIIREQAELERRADLDVAALNLLNEDIKELREQKEELIESEGLSSLDLKKYPLTPNTGNLQKYAAKKFEDVNDALDSMTDKRDRLLTDISGLKEMSAIQTEQAVKVLETEREYRTRGAFSHVFERSDFDAAQEDYKSKLESMENPDGTPMYNERDVAIRLHFHNKAYNQFHAVEASANVEAAFDLKERNLGVSFTEWKNDASPLTSLGAKPLVPFENVPNLVNDAVSKFQAIVTNDAQTMYDSGQWTVKNAPIKVNSKGEATYDENWFAVEYKDVHGNPTGQTRLDRIVFDMTMGIEDFLGHGNTTDAFKTAIKPGTPSNLLLTGTSEQVLIPGMGYGNLLWGSQFNLMEDFYNQDTIQKHINQRIMKKSTVQSRALSIINQNKI